LLGAGSRPSDVAQGRQLAERPDPSLTPRVSIRHSASRNPHSVLRPTVRPGFTLVELLVTISIIAILASMIMFAMFSAQEAARVSKTRSTIAKLDAILREKWESYSSRRVPITIPQNFTSRQAARARLDGLREMMRMELPDRWTDIATKDGSNNLVPSMPISGISPPSIWTAYLNRYASAYSVSSKQFPTDANERSECLYMIVTMGATDGGGRELFGESEIGDTDGDGFPEFLDGWGRPIRFLRWAPGFSSELQQPTEPFNDANGNGIFDSGDTFTDRNGNGVHDEGKPDPFDPMHVYPTRNAETPAQTQPTFAIYPLIYSAGPDGEYDIYGGVDNYAYTMGRNNPFLLPSDLKLTPGDPDAPAQIGTPLDIGATANGRDEWLDNIHNHLLGTR
jgi:prepilin-type N-terminal cleavage/methylation domain-containing protein